MKKRVYRNRQHYFEMRKIKLRLIAIWNILTTQDFILIEGRINKKGITESRFVCRTDFTGIDDIKIVDDVLRRIKKEEEK